MNNQFQGNQYNAQDQNSFNEFGTILEAVHKVSSMEEQSFLLTVIHHLQQALISKTNHELRSSFKGNENLSLAIYEKCLSIKQKN